MSRNRILITVRESMSDAREDPLRGHNLMDNRGADGQTRKPVYPPSEDERHRSRYQACRIFRY